ncbi:cytochrome c oxidase assembly protein [Pseudooceanicola sediminis]|uniref:Cytochrome c oxidase assembly protein CtaG n=1 Tax=Pseudooceanicola sediminis TaxID=2211117 RepID=A0A399J436_9RHOB|nr:cytochrome c oxidase assembly protein [Pseudooceanicola sediminis]KAA2311527.1 cytochrome c oxidase assembly protein [Puniceibacterium sp. HSS470]RII40031.1 cytochrome c oxidase assembly protein [Pseudooceanicola sediminis]|tara:strand:+ start:99763 stop:100350 length:588 start_codon:yes stop_codon:yes gene_type:complete
MDAKTKTVVQTVGVVVVMASLAWAAVPAYNYFCKVTGFGGVTQEADAGSDTVLDQTIKVRFDASTDSKMPWSFKPVQREMELRIGETGLAFFEAHNPTDRVIAGTASYNVTPYEAGGFFTKIQCFCFNEQVLQPGETVEMPVTFYVDPAIVDDRDAKYVHTITLGYTFYETDLPEGYAAEEQAALKAEQGSTDLN